MFLIASIEIFQIKICITFFFLAQIYFSQYFCAEINTVLFLSFLICVLTIDCALLRIVSVAPILGKVLKAFPFSLLRRVVPILKGVLVTYDFSPGSLNQQKLHGWLV